MENNTGIENICKIIILESSQRRLFHPKSRDNNNGSPDRQQNKRPSMIKKCLFGKSDPDDTKRMLEEQYVLDQQRFLSRFGFDVETIEHLERGKDDVKENIENVKSSKEVKKCLGRKILKARRKVSFGRVQQQSQGQQFITDFYQSRKTGGSGSLVLEKRAASSQVSEENILPVEQL